MSRIHQERKKKRLWDTGEKQSKEPVFTIIRKKKEEVDKKPPGRKTGITEVKVCGFSVQAFQEEKQTQPQTRDRTFT